MSPDPFHDLVLSDEQEMILDTARKFAEEVLAPQAEEIDREARFPTEAFRQMAELGFLGLPVSESAGGAGMGYLAYGLALEEVAKVCGSTAFGLAGHIACAYACDRFGSDAQREAQAAPLATGEVAGAFAATEPAGGPGDGLPATAARGSGEAWRLDGRKALVANAARAAVFVVTARTEAGDPGLFFVPRDCRGLRVESAASSLGLRAAASADVVLDGVTVPLDARIGAGRDGAAALAASRTAIAAIALGLAEGAQEHGRRYSQERVAFGKTLSCQQAVLFKIAEMATRIEAARHLVVHACRLEDRHAPAERAAAIAKVVASECAVHCADEAIQIHGGYGYVSEYHVERIYRDAKLTEIAEGTSEACRFAVGRDALGA